MENAENPFAALLGESKAKGIDKSLIEEIFLFTLRNKDKVSQSKSRNALLCLSDVIVIDSGKDSEMGEELLSHALFERLMLNDTKKYLIEGANEHDALTQDALLYLHRAFLASEQLKATHKDKVNDLKRISELIIINASTCMRTSDFFPGRVVWEQWRHIMESYEDENTDTIEFLVQCVHKVYSDDEPLEALGALKANFYPILSKIQTDVSQSNMVNLKKNTFKLLEFFACDKRIPQMGEVLIDYTMPNPNTNGGAFMDTIFGHLFSLSIMPKNQNGPYEYFGDLNFEARHTDTVLWQCMASHQEAVFKLVKQLLIQGPTTKQKVLHWFAKCLHANIARGHLWNNLNGGMDSILHQNASDAFMIGLTSVLIRLCTPLCEPSLKVLLVDPTYCAVQDEDRQAKQVNMIKAFEETCLLPTQENEKRITAQNKFNFVTELFYLAHKAYELSYRSSIDRFTRMSRELHNLQTAYQDVANSDRNNDILLRKLKQQLQQYLCLRNCLMEPENDAAILKFFEASAIWLTEIALTSEEQFNEAMSKFDFAPYKRYNRMLPLKVEYVPPVLRSIPENVIDNIVAYLTFSRHFPQGQFIQMYPSSHDAFFKMILLFMGSSELVKNPHLRAKLAEALELFLPKREGGVGGSGTFLTHVFDDHPERLWVVQSLLNVFVSIEMTGQSVQFEQKFNYRRPMYAVMEYLWTKEEYIQSFRELATEAEKNMEAIEAPLFLRFINLLINDAIFLLDESLNNLQQIRQQQEAQARGEWDNLPQNERQQLLSNLHHLGMLARFDNILGRDTINVLKLITSEIKSIFCHSTMVDRITAMLNYFLLNLVGPQKEKFKVKDKKEFEFDPAKMVLEICHVYINLSSSNSFCLAVSQDGRSYSSDLFSYAENILIRIGGGQLIAELSEFADKVQKMEKQYKQEQECIMDAPDEFLDPIMSTLMTDPVILPSSKVTVDRSTIARHLLSDQTDPFNRAPLTMDKVVPNEALKTDIEKWLAEKRSNFKNSSSDTS